MYVSDSLLNALADEAQLRDEGIVLVDDLGNVITSTQTATWDTTDVGTLQLTNDITFQITAGDTVAGWRVLNTDNPDFGADFDVAETYSNAGEFKLSATDTSFTIQLGV